MKKKPKKPEPVVIPTYIVPSPEAWDDLLRKPQEEDETTIPGKTFFNSLHYPDADIQYN